MESTPWPPTAVPSIDVLGAISVAVDIALGLPSGRGVRTTSTGKYIADELGRAADDRLEVFYATLDMHACRPSRAITSPLPAMTTARPIGKVAAVFVRERLDLSSTAALRRIASAQGAQGMR